MAGTGTGTRSPDLTHRGGGGLLCTLWCGISHQPFYLKGKVCRIGGSEFDFFFFT